MIDIYTDGSCIPNPGRGGWAAALIHHKKRLNICGAFVLTTNNRMEIYAALAAFRRLTRPTQVRVVSDSIYLLNGIKKLPEWKGYNWVRGFAKIPITNCDLWIELEKLTSQHEVITKWVKGHGEDPENNCIDALATKARLNEVPVIDLGYIPNERDDNERTLL
jgi:ribonuclease HI